jgi:hypothetical protein
MDEFLATHLASTKHSAGTAPHSTLGWPLCIPASRNSQPLARIPR